MANVLNCYSFLQRFQTVCFITLDITLLLTYHNLVGCFHICISLFQYRTGPGFSFIGNMNLSQRPVGKVSGHQ